MSLDVGALYEAHAGAVRAYIVKRLPHTDRNGAAEDLVAAVFERAVRAGDRWEQRGIAPLAWLFTIAARLLIDHARATQARPVGATLMGVDDVRATADAGSERHVTRLVLADVLGGLLPEHRAVLTERFVIGRDVAQTAEAMQRSEDAVKKLQRRALVNAARLWGVGA